MEILRAELEYNCPTWNVTSFGFYHHADYVEISGDGKKMYLIISGSSDCKEIFFSIISILFIYYGSFPELLKVELNGVAEDTEQYNSLFFTSPHFKKECFKLHDINSSTINEKVMEKFAQLSGYPILSLQALVSCVYDKMMSDHKLTLLLQVIDGLVSDDEGRSVDEKIKKQLIPNFNSKKTQQIPYAYKVYYLCDKNFFVYDDNLKILPLLQVDDIEFTRTITDTRHHNTHFTAPKVHSLEKGSDNIIYFTLIYYILRIYIIKKLDVPLSDDLIADGLRCIKNWIFGILFRNYVKTGC